MFSDLRNHQRAVTCGSSVAELFHVLHSCKRNCEVIKLAERLEALEPRIYRPEVFTKSILCAYVILMGVVNTE